MEIRLDDIVTGDINSAMNHYLSSLLQLPLHGCTLPGPRRSSAIHLVGPNPAMGCPTGVLDSLFVGDPDLTVPDVKSKGTYLQDSEFWCFCGANWLAIPVCLSEIDLKLLALNPKIRSNPSKVEVGLYCRRARRNRPTG